MSLVVPGQIVPRLPSEAAARLVEAPVTAESLTDYLATIGETSSRFFAQHADILQLEIAPLVCYTDPWNYSVIYQDKDSQERIPAVRFNYFRFEGQAESQLVSYSRYDNDTKCLYECQLPTPKSAKAILRMSRDVAPDLRPNSIQAEEDTLPEDVIPYVSDVDLRRIDSYVDISKLLSQQPSVSCEIDLADPHKPTINWKETLLPWQVGTTPVELEYRKANNGFVNSDTPIIANQLNTFTTNFSPFYLTMGAQQLNRNLLDNFFTSPNDRQLNLKDFINGIFLPQGGTNFYYPLALASDQSEFPGILDPDQLRGSITQQNSSESHEYRANYYLYDRGAMGMDIVLPGTLTEIAGQAGMAGDQSHNLNILHLVPSTIPDLIRIQRELSSTLPIHAEESGDADFGRDSLLIPIRVDGARKPVTIDLFAHDQDISREELVKRILDSYVSDYLEKVIL